MRICFVSAPQGSAFMRELLGVAADAVERAGGSVSLHTGAYPVMPSPCVYVVIPHEYFVVTPVDHQPTAAQRSRTIGFCVEHPGNQTFEVSFGYARCLGGVVDINDDSLAELRRRGIPAERFVLGYSPLWDAWGGSDKSDRPIDITYLGTTDIRRAQLLALQAGELAVWNTRLLIPPHEPMIRSRPDFLMGEAKLQHLASTKVLINLHRGGSRSLEWVRILESMCNGCVVTSERSDDFWPLVPGEDLVFAEPTRVAAAASALLRDPQRLGSMRQAAWAKCRSIDMRASAERLIEMAAEIERGGRPAESRL
ncbi:MAG: glycosyltransferase, partial [Candidatus Dormiibacterota bacterium]